MYCPLTDQCQNFDYKCLDCAASLDTEELAAISELALLYRPMLLSSPRHPVALRKAQLKKQAEEHEKARQKTKAWQQKSRQVRRAYKEEAVTREAVIRATKRSGALNGDGDSRFGDGQWGIDDKYHSKATSTISVSVAEVDKARDQTCIVVVTLANGRKFVVADLDTFCSAATALAVLGKK